MKAARILLATAALFALACGNASASGDAIPACTGAAPTTLLDGADAYDSLSVAGGFFYVDVPGTGVERCPITGCTSPTSVVDTDAFVTAALGDSSVVYATQIASSDGVVAGEIRSVGVDGSGDQSLLGGISYPAFVATSGGRTFWVNDSFAVDDTPATVHCIGCGGSGSAPWIMGFAGGTYGMVADANDVYVLADDASLGSIELVACSVGAPCFSEPRLLLSGLDRTITAQQIAADGTYVYVARPLQRDLLRVDNMGQSTTVYAGSETITALAVDAAAGEVYFGTDGGDVERVKSDGSTQPVTLSCAGTSIAAIALDPKNVYLLAGESGSRVYAVAR